MSVFSRLLSVFLCVFAAASVSACSNSPIAPGLTGRIPIVAALAQHAGDPATGTIASLRVDVRDESGTVIGSPIIVPVTQTASTFSFEIETAAGEARTITVLAIGERPVSGGLDGPDGGIGVLYRGSISGVDVRVRGNGSTAIDLGSFVPAFQPLEVVSSGVRIRWTAEPGAQAYSLTRFYDGVSLTTTPVLDTSFVDDTGASRFQVVAIETSGRRSAPSDILAGK